MRVSAERLGLLGDFAARARRGPFAQQIGGRACQPAFARRVRKTAAQDDHPQRESRRLVEAFERDDAQSVFERRLFRAGQLHFEDFRVDWRFALGRRTFS